MKLEPGDRFTGNLPYDHRFEVLSIGRFHGSRKKAIVLIECSKNYPNTIVYDMEQFKRKKLKPWTDKEWYEWSENLRKGNP